MNRSFRVAAMLLVFAGFAVAAGPTPPEAPVAKPAEEAIAPKPSRDVAAERDRLIAEADAKLRQGLANLAATFPTLSKMLAPDIGGKSTPGTVHIVAESDGLNRPPDTRPLPRRVVSADECLVRIVLLPMDAPTGQTTYAPVFKRLWLKGEVSVRADDPPLDVALRKLTDEALAPLRDLDAVGVPWGPPVEGVQARLVPARPLWDAIDYPPFRAEVRNRGERDLQLCQAGPAVELQVDGKWYKWHDTTSPVNEWRPLPAGKHFKDISLGVGHWENPDGKVYVNRAPGKHTVRFAFIARPKRGETGDPVRVLTNIVEVQLPTPKRPDKKASPR